MGFVSKVFDSDRFYLIITTIFLLIGSFSCPWFVKLPLYIDWTYKILLTLFNIRTIYLFWQMVDLTTNSLRIILRNSTIAIYLLEIVNTIKTQVWSGQKVKEFVKVMEEARKQYGVEDCQIDRTTRTMIIILVLLRGLDIYELSVVGSSHFPHVLVYTIQTAQLCQWGVLISIASTSFKNLKQVIQSCAKQDKTKHRQTQNMGMILETFRVYRKMYSEINLHCQSMLLLKTITNNTFFVRSVYEVWRLNIVGQVYEGENVHNIAQTYCPFFFQFFICMITNSANQKVEDLKYTIDKVLTFDLPHYINIHLQTLAEEVQTSVFNISPYGLYSIHLSMISSILATAVSYMIIMTQFNDLA